MGVIHTSLIKDINSLCPLFTTVYCFASYKYLFQNHNVFTSFPAALVYNISSKTLLILSLQKRDTIDNIHI